MAQLYGRVFSKLDIMRRVGDISQIAGATSCELKSGRATGVPAIDVKTGSGFRFTILPGRGMDLAWADYKGMALSFISKAGVSSANFFEEPGLGFLRNFTCGLLTTCGLTYMGAPCVDEGKALGLHGRISNTPAEDVSVLQGWEEDEFTIRIRGKVRESAMFGENLVLTRELVTRLGDSKLQIHDRIENCGFDAQPFMLFYHFNFGYPLVDRDTKLMGSLTKVRGRDARAEEGLAHYSLFEEPTHGFTEQVFYHDLQPDAEGAVWLGLLNPNLGPNGLGVYVKSRKDQATHFGEWKQMGEGDYVVGLEPSTWYPEGRAEARRRGELKQIEPGEIKQFDLEVGVVEGESELGGLLTSP
jgi:hypothetical protein